MYICRLTAGMELYDPSKFMKMRSSYVNLILRGHLAQVTSMKALRSKYFLIQTNTNRITRKTPPVIGIVNFIPELKA